MVNPARIIDLKAEPDFLAQYVELRNQYGALLLSEPVELMKTMDWVRSEGIEIRGIAHGETLLGAAVLYLGKGGEIAFFTRNPSQGVGSRLLDAIEEAARNRKLSEVWAWVLSDNVAAQRVFVKNGYRLDKKAERTHRQMPQNGFLYRKDIR